MESSRNDRKPLVSRGNVWWGMFPPPLFYIIKERKKISNVKLTLEDVIEYTKKFGVIVIDKEYKSSSSKMNFICKCDSTFTRTFSKMKHNNIPYCVKCTSEERKESDLVKFQKKYKEKFNWLKQSNANFITNIDEVWRVHDRIEIICECGEIYGNIFRDIKYLKCARCSNRKQGGRNKTYEEVKELIETTSECKLLSKTYTGRLQDIELLCKCGNHFITKLERFLGDNKKQCTPCGIAKRSGENNPNWNGGVTPETQKLRHSPEYKKWRQEVFKRDLYSCQCCGDNRGGNLQAHHIENFSTNESLIYDVNNGITLCETHHDFRYKDSFHHRYTTRNNNIFQLQEYFDDIRSALNLPLITIESVINRNS